MDINKLVIQWGKLSSVKAHTIFSITLPKAYTTLQMAVCCGYRHTTSTNNCGTVHIYSLNNTTLQLLHGEYGSSGISAYYYICIGS